MRCASWNPADGSPGVTVDASGSMGTLSRQCLPGLHVPSCLKLAVIWSIVMSLFHSCSLDLPTANLPACALAYFFKNY